MAKLLYEWQNCSTASQSALLLSHKSLPTTFPLPARFEKKGRIRVHQTEETANSYTNPFPSPLAGPGHMVADSDAGKIQNFDSEDSAVTAAAAAADGDGSSNCRSCSWT